MYQKPKDMSIFTSSLNSIRITSKRSRLKSATGGGISANQRHRNNGRFLKYNNDLPDAVYSPKESQTKINTSRTPVPIEVRKISSNHSFEPVLGTQSSVIPYKS